ncbi:aminomethyl-transferring glycine dehydrogenase subunit GcvPB [Acidobacteria bacterium AH-259-A15]|nr:aminomethyl-transferring glycine dehydrogenase subunit GcvPB [Acidobacteria bacterium AH-259-A15]
MSRTFTAFNLDESLIFEKSSPGKSAYTLPPLDVEDVPPERILDPEYLREEVSGFPEVSEAELICHYTRMSTWNYHIDLGMYPLGSCTMKYNPKLNERVARIPGIAFTHPLQEDEHSQGNLEILFKLQQYLKELTGMQAVSLQPAGGAQGEFTGMLMVRAYHMERDRPRKYVLIPDSAHGTNPATARMAGYEVISVPSDHRGRIDVKALAQEMSEDVSCLMLTNPNTMGIFESEIEEMARIVHTKGGLMYMDGANFNALMGYARPGDMGIDVLHLNLHKTFSTPHGGGGPGSGPVACRENLSAYLPVPRIEREGARYRLNYEKPESVGRVHAFYGNFGMAVRALCYILTCGQEGLKELSEIAVLSANYIRHQLKGYYDLPYDTPTLHEVVFSDKIQNRKGVKTLDIVKRLMDYGFHPPTIYFPLIVHGALMIEPAESQSKEELDAFIEAMISISREAEEEPEKVINAPVTTKLTRLDETRAARSPILRWTPGNQSES